MNNLPITLRPAQLSDYGFILKSIGTQTHKLYPQNFVPNQIHFPYMRRITDRFIADYPCIIAHIDGYSDDLCGFVFIKNYTKTSLILPYAFVKSIYRRQGIFKHILNSFDPMFKNKSIICPIFFHLFPELEQAYHLIYDPTILKDLEIRTYV